MTTVETPKPQGQTPGIVKRTPMAMGERGFDFSLDGAIRFAQGLIDGGMVPKGITHPGAVVGLIEAGKELGLAPMYALANLTFTNGRLGIMGDCAKALIRRSGLLEAGTDFKEIYSGEEFTPSRTCTVSAHRKGQPEPFSESFSIAAAITAKLVRLDGKKVLSRKGGGEWVDYGPWSTYTKRMLMYRALGFLARDRFSDVLGGAVLTEELRDYSPEEQRVLAAPPSEPDPLLVQPVTNVVAEEVHEAEVVSEKRVSAPADAPSIDEAEQIKAVEKLEGQIVTAESIEQLTDAWTKAAPLLKSLGDTERARLEKLYTQNASNFGTQQPTTKRAPSRR